MFDFMDNYPMLTLEIVFGGIIAYYLAKYLIDSKKGINSQARYSYETGCNINKWE